MERTYILYGGIIDYDKSFFSQEQSNSIFLDLKDNIQWEQLQYSHRKTGKKYFQPRLTSWYADNPNMEYSYSGVTQTVHAWIPSLLSIKNKIEKVTNSNYNSVLLNYYRDGKDSVGLHADDEKELGINANIASVSLGAGRDFKLVNYRQPKDNINCNPNEDNRIVINNFLNDGFLLVMSGTTQHYWKHEIPKSQYLIEGRINLTFRKFYS